MAALARIYVDRIRAEFPQLREFRIGGWSFGGLVALEMARVFQEVDLLLVPSLRDEQLTITNFTGHPSLTLRAGFVQVSEARSDWAPDPAHPLPRFSPPRRVPHGITLVGRLFDEGVLGRTGMALERTFGVSAETPPGF